MSDEYVEQSDASPEVSSEPQETVETAPEPSQEAPEQTASPEPQETPFHEHPRFKELVDQKNQFANRVQQYEQQMAQMHREMQEFKQARQQQSNPQKDELVERLKGIDPEFGSRFEELNSLRDQVSQFQQWQQQLQAQQVRENAYNQLNGLHEQFKVPESQRTYINSQIEQIAATNPNLSVNDLPRVYQQVHENFNKFVEDLRRSERESYVTSKKEDVKAPTSQPKGEPVKAGTKKPGFSKDPAKAREELIQRTLKIARAENDV